MPQTFPEIAPMPHVMPSQTFEAWKGQQFCERLNEDEARERIFAQQSQVQAPQTYAMHANSHCMSEAPFIPDTVQQQWNGLRTWSMPTHAPCFPGAPAAYDPYAKNQHMHASVLPFVPSLRLFRVHKFRKHGKFQLPSHRSIIKSGNIRNQSAAGCSYGPRNYQQQFLRVPSA